MSFIVMSSEKKIAEGNEGISQAEKYLKTSLFKWKPDYDSAATEYSKAATCFRTAKAFGQCKDCLLNAADCYAKNHSFFSAAKSYEQAALVCKEMDDYMGAVNMINKACQLFREHGTPDTAAIALEKGAKMVESRHPEVALDLFSKAAEVVMIEDRPRQAAEYCGKAARILTKLKRYDEAADMIKKEMQYHVMSENIRAAGRLVVAEVLVHLMREDYVAADKAFKEGAGYTERDESGTLVDLLEGYDQGDAELMNRALNSPFVKHMDVEYARIARSLVVAEDDSAKKKTGTSGGGTTNQDDDDEFAGGLL